MREILIEFNIDEVSAREQVEHLARGMETVTLIGYVPGVVENFPTHRVIGREDELMLFVLRWAMHDGEGGFFPEIIAGNGGEELTAALQQILESDLLTDERVSELMKGAERT